MRLASDPLLLRALLLRVEHPERVALGKAPVLPLPTTMASARVRNPVQTRYAWRDTLLEPSLFAERFEASAEDWSEALVAGGITEPLGVGTIVTLLVSVVVALGSLGLLLVLAA